jgi:LysR family transcriptional regulator of gallate degradation
MGMENRREPVLSRPDDALAEGHEALTYLRDLMSVAKAGSIARSADAVFKAPSAVARSVTELERLLGVTLFERQPRGMLLNAYGEAVLRRARRIEQEAELAAQEWPPGRKPGSRSHARAVLNLMFNGRKLVQLCTLATLQHSRAVAHRLNLSAAGVSMFLTRLEDDLGQPLFTRAAQGMLATEPADRLVLRARRVLAEVRQLGSDLSALQGALRGTVTVGALPLGRTLWLPSAMADTLREHPQLRFRSVESPYEALVADLRCGDIDFILGALRPDAAAQGLRSELLLHDSMAVLARRGHPLAKRTGLSLVDLQGQQWALPRRDAPARQLLDQVFTRQGLAPPEPSVETGDLAILRALLIQSDLITAISAQQLSFEVADERLAVIDLVLPHSERPIGITLREGALPSPAVLALLDALRRWALGLAQK